MCTLDRVWEWTADESMEEVVKIEYLLFVGWLNNVFVLHAEVFGSIKYTSEMSFYLGVMSDCRSTIVLGVGDFWVWRREDIEDP